MSEMSFDQFVAKVKGKIGRPCKEGAPELFAVAFAIFRAHFHDDDPLELICEKWCEWDEDKTKSMRLARAAIQAVNESRNHEKGGNWRPIETAPRDGTEIIAVCISPHAVGRPRFCRWHTCKKGLRAGLRYWSPRGSDQQIHPTHWIPVPPYFGNPA